MLRSLEPLERPEVPPAVDDQVAAWSTATHERNLRVAMVAARRAGFRDGPAVAAIVVNGECRVVGEGYAWPEESPNAAREAVRCALCGGWGAGGLALYVTVPLPGVWVEECRTAPLAGVFFGTEELGEVEVREAVFRTGKNEVLPVTSSNSPFAANIRTS